MSGTFNTINPEDVIPAGRSAWRKRSRLPTSSFASHPESCSVYICERKKNVCGHVFYIFFFFFSDIAFCYDFWNTKFVWYNTAKISKGVQCIILPASVMDLFVCVFGWYYL